MANILSSDDAGRGKSAGGGGGRSRVQHDTDRSSSVRAIDAPADDDGDAAGGCFAGDDDGGAGAPEFSSAGAADVNEGVGAFVEDHSGDLGACLSMHQPWASLAVYGVKQIEGAAQLGSLFGDLLVIARVSVLRARAHVLCVSMCVYALRIMSRMCV